MNHPHPPIAPGATVLEGVAHNGKSCRIIDQTGSIPETQLAALLEDLIAQRHFGLKGLSAKGGNTIRLGEPDFTHIQVGEQMYRLLLFPYEARLDSF